MSPSPPIPPPGEPPSAEDEVPAGAVGRSSAAAGQEPDGDGRRGAGRWRPLFAGLVVGVVVLASGAIFLLSRRSGGSYVDDVDQLCSEVNERFGSDLALGEAFGDGDDLERLGQRIEVAGDLHRQVEQIEVPANESPPDEWLEKLDGFIGDMRAFKVDWENAQPGSDMVLVMTSNLVDKAAIETGEAAERYGLESCSEVDSWELVPGGHSD